MLFQFQRAIYRDVNWQNYFIPAERGERTISLKSRVFCRSQYQFQNRRIPCFCNSSFGALEVCHAPGHMWHPSFLGVHPGADRFVQQLCLDSSQYDLGLGQSNILQLIKEGSSFGISDYHRLLGQSTAQRREHSDKQMLSSWVCCCSDCYRKCGIICASTLNSFSCFLSCGSTSFSGDIQPGSSFKFCTRSLLIVGEHTPGEVHLTWPTTGAYSSGKWSPSQISTEKLYQNRTQLNINLHQRLQVFAGSSSHPRLTSIQNNTTNIMCIDIFWLQKVPHKRFLTASSDTFKSIVPNAKKKNILEGLGAVGPGVWTPWKYYFSYLFDAGKDECCTRFLAADLEFDSPSGGIEFFWRTCSAQVPQVSSCS